MISGYCDQTGINRNQKNHEGSSPCNKLHLELGWSCPAQKKLNISQLCTGIVRGIFGTVQLTVLLPTRMWFTGRNTTPWSVYSKGAFIPFAENVSERSQRFSPSNFLTRIIVLFCSQTRRKYIFRFRETHSQSEGFKGVNSTARGGVRRTVYYTENSKSCSAVRANDVFSAPVMLTTSPFRETVLEGEHFGVGVLLLAAMVSIRVFCVFLHGVLPRSNRHRRGNRVEIRRGQHTDGF